MQFYHHNTHICFLKNVKIQIWLNWIATLSFLQTGNNSDVPELKGKQGKACYGMECCLNNQKGQTVDTCNPVDESEKHVFKCKIHVVWFHLYDTLGKAKLGRNTD